MPIKIRILLTIADSKFTSKPLLTSQMIVFLKKNLPLILILFMKRVPTLLHIVHILSEIRLPQIQITLVNQHILSCVGLEKGTI